MKSLLKNTAIFILAFVGTTVVILTASNIIYTMFHFNFQTIAKSIAGIIMIIVVSSIVIRKRVRKS